MPCRARSMSDTPRTRTLTPACQPTVAQNAGERCQGLRDTPMKAGRGAASSGTGWTRTQTLRPCGGHLRPGLCLVAGRSKRMMSEAHRGHLDTPSRPSMQYDTSGPRRASFSPCAQDTWAPLREPRSHGRPGAGRGSCRTPAGRRGHRGRHANKIAAWPRPSLTLPRMPPLAQAGTTTTGTPASARPASWPTSGCRRQRRRRPNPARRTDRECE